VDYLLEMGNSKPAVILAIPDFAIPTSVSTALLTFWSYHELVSNQLFVASHMLVDSLCDVT
jgi:hypothetical protein